MHLHCRIQGSEDGRNGSANWRTNVVYALLNHTSKKSHNLLLHLAAIPMHNPTSGELCNL
jgi:hypothetical protein